MLPLDIAGRKPDQAWFDTVIDTVGLRDRLEPPADRALRRPAAAGRLRPGAGHPAGDHLRRRADRQPRLALRRRGAGFLRRSVTRLRPDHRDGHPRPDRGRVRRPGAVPRRRPDRRRDARPDRRRGARPDEEARARPTRDEPCAMLRATLKSLLARKLRLILPPGGRARRHVRGRRVRAHRHAGPLFDNLFATVNKNVAVDVRGAEVTPGSSGDDGERPPRPSRPRSTRSSRSTASPRSRATVVTPTAPSSSARTARS